MKDLRQRGEIPKEETWAVEAFYRSWEEWEKECAEVAQSTPRFEGLAALHGHLGKGPHTVLEAIGKYFSTDRKLTKLYTYAHLRHDEDLAEETAKSAFQRITSLAIDFREETSWIEPELLALPPEALERLIRVPELTLYRIYLERLKRLKSYTLSHPEERLLALAEKPLQTPSLAFSLFNNAELKFADAEDEGGAKRPLTLGKYLPCLRSSDRSLRRTAFLNLHASYLAHENTFCELLNGEIQRHLFQARARGYSSCLEASLYPLEIDTTVYTTLLKTVEAHVPSLHAYVALRKKLLGVDTIHLYDLAAPLISEPPKKWSYFESVETIVAALAPLGNDYGQALREGLTTKRWVDIYENERKRSGAYSSGCFDSMPYILMNFQGTFNDLETLAHEAGHSMHSLKTHAAQPYIYATTPIFVAEVASTFHELLVLRYLMARAQTRDEKAFLICQEIDMIRATLFRQTQFARFELDLHTWAEKGIPLTPTLLKKRYEEINRLYYGSEIILDGVSHVEWARIPHFYYNFYVYQYATGLSAAFALASKILAGEEGAVSRYLTFLASGSSMDSLTTLERAGVNMRQGEPVEVLMRRFSALTQELAALLTKDVAPK